ncbi:MAG: cellulase family glycosylhydrolase [Ruminococcus sp.]|nr:cellulase family glycosylhydrolase [Ruminococcus sp.]
MLKKIMAVISATALALSLSGCGNSKDKSDGYIQSTFNRNIDKPVSKEKPTEEETTAEPTTIHVSPVETVTAEVATQITVDKVIEKTDGSNTIKFNLSDLMEEGDTVSSFTFVIESADGLNIGQFKGGCGISVTDDYPSENKRWYQSPDFTASTQGTYGEIKWEVPSDVSECVSKKGEVLFGYWWGNSSSIKINNVICHCTRTREVPVDGEVSYDVGQSVSHAGADNTIKIKTADFLPENTVPEVVTFNISSSGGLRKFTGAFGYKSSAGNYQSPDTSVFTDGSSLSLTWFVQDKAKKLISEDGEIMLGYWWSEQPEITLDSIDVKYSLGSGGVPVTAKKNSALEKEDPVKPVSEKSDGFRSAQEIVDDINVGWNLGNSLDSYDTGKTGLATETGWGNLKTTEDMILAVKDAGFNAVRIPVTWGEHMDGDVIQQEWLDRVQTVVDYAYKNDMFVIVNVHHDDYIWLKPDETVYAENSRKLCSIWTQVAERFKDYGDRLIFEGINETRTIGSELEWLGGTPEERAVINKYEHDFVETVRATGGNNSERSLIVTSYAASAETSSIDDIEIPDDKNIIVSVHYYAPWKFSKGIDSHFTDDGKKELSNKFAELREKFIDNGTPLIIGEFGCVNATDNATRAEYYGYYISSALAEGIKCFIWDNSEMSGESSFGLFNRSKLTWNEEILSAVQNAVE